MKDLSISRSITSLPLLYNDSAFLAVNKPKGFLSHPNPGDSHRKCAFNGDYDFDKRCFHNQERPVWLLHRLDKETSGILLATTSSEIASIIRQSFSDLKVKKKYRTLVAGFPNPAKGLWRDHIHTSRNKNQVRSKVIANKSTNAESRFRIVRRFPEAGLSLLDIELITGRTHQIRVQCASRKHPIIGDRIYGNFSLNRTLRRSIGIGRLFLHASVLELPHPTTHKQIRIEAPLPSELEEVLLKAK